MPVASQRVQAVRGGYAKRLRDKGLALPMDQPHLARWVREVLGFAADHAGYTFEQTLDLYVAEMGKREGIKPWQVQQAVDAARTCLPSDGAGRSITASAVPRSLMAKPMPASRPRVWTMPACSLVCAR